METADTRKRTDDSPAADESPVRPAFTPRGLSIDL